MIQYKQSRVFAAAVYKDRVVRSYMDQKNMIGTDKQNRLVSADKRQNGVVAVDKELSKVTT